MDVAWHQQYIWNLTGVKTEELINTERYFICTTLYYVISVEGITDKYKATLKSILQTKKLLENVLQIIDLYLKVSIST